MSKKILVVDDEENIRLLYKDEFEEAGYQVETAGDAASGMKKFKSFSPDIVVVDMRLPGADGLSVVSSIREINRDIPLVICSAYGEYKHDPTSWGSDAYVVKSANLDELKETVKKLL